MAPVLASLRHAAPVLACASPLGRTRASSALRDVCWHSVLLSPSNSILGLQCTGST